MIPLGAASAPAHRPGVWETPLLLGGLIEEIIRVVTGTLGLSLDPVWIGALAGVLVLFHFGHTIATTLATVGRLSRVVLIVLGVVAIMMILGVAGGLVDVEGPIRETIEGVAGSV